ncbi:carbohydrate ABC transporter permease [Saccharomonospora xinjiangensis]|uniref:carbohydrate ABC transporter permease n=1 Tax=Saccharomonospora xinjiangensis TaxID=75294 RepID=UPI00106F3800|nr:carbohydrate ABC transporter permease [Saccharomonospora xinjiangensis]QBQ60635.1 Trehalose transport system permease protein SugB [Saccharomonospora xinjiangensis]
MSTTSSGERTFGATVRRIAPYAGVAVIILYCLAPFYWMVVSSFRRTSDIFDLSALPSPWSLENYRAVFSGDNEFGSALLNSLLVAGVTTAATVLVATLAAYALARLEFRFKNAVLAIVIATSMFPGISLLVPLLKLFTDIGWINTYQSMIVPNLSFALPLAIWYLTTFFRQLPYELEEAARVDGCTPGQAFRKVILPIAVPGVFTTAIIVFVVAWNEFIIALTMVNDPSMQTVTVRISQFVGVAVHDSPFGTRMAAGVIATVPLVIAVLLFQRRIVAGLTSGGVK